MIKRKPVRTLLYFTCILMVRLSFLYSFYFLIGIVLLSIAAAKIELITSKCPRCKKNNSVERRVRFYSCKWCRTPLRMEPDGWSYITPGKSEINP